MYTTFILLKQWKRKMYKKYTFQEEEPDKFMDLLP